ncbi:unnamed protein product [Rangifer tarandus platyrhynchus]|uniref:Uncharacterized protein n=1 Tax=Rangifer tarandus platyrhynchus TaxID=3082113 RepID=A0ABN8ZIU8_RANTA|nr:unnamed protein product [Rangifer tarandus platyrhynchus]
MTPTPRPSPSPHGNRNSHRSVLGSHKCPAGAKGSSSGCSATVTHDEEPQRKSSPPGHSGRTSPALLLQFCLVSVFFSAAQLSGLVSEPSPVPEMSTPSHSALDQHPASTSAKAAKRPCRPSRWARETPVTSSDSAGSSLSLGGPERVWPLQQDCLGSSAWTPVSALLC